MTLWISAQHVLDSPALNLRGEIPSQTVTTEDVRAGEELETIPANFIIKADPTGEDRVEKLLLLLGSIVIQSEPEPRGVGMCVLHHPDILSSLVCGELQRELQLEEIQRICAQPADPLEQCHLPRTPETLKLATEPGDLG